MKTITNFLTFIVIILSLAACSSDSGGGGGVTPDGTPSKPVVEELNSEDIKNNDYSLKSSLDFNDSDEEIFKRYEGTSLEHTVKQFRLYYADQKRITSAQAKTLSQFCSLIVEVGVTTERQDVSFAAGDLHFVQIQHFEENGEYEVTVVLQAALFKQFWVSCKNTPDSEAIDSHVGHILEIQPK